MSQEPTDSIPSTSYLHQGSDIIPLQFIGFRNSQLGVDVDIENSTSQQKLCANVAAQIVAFACGKEDENLNKNFKGKRPSSIIIGEQLTPGFSWCITCSL